MTFRYNSQDIGVNDTRPKRFTKMYRAQRKSFRTPKPLRILNQLIARPEFRAVRRDRRITLMEYNDDHGAFEVSAEVYSDQAAARYERLT